jgi:hypothetical protein
MPSISLTVPHYKQEFANHPQEGLVMSMLDDKRAAEAMPLVHYDATGKPVPPWPPPVDLRKLPRQVQEAILAASAEWAETRTEPIRI